MNINKLSIQNCKLEKENFETIDNLEIFKTIQELKKKNIIEKNILDELKYKTEILVVSFFVLNKDTDNIIKILHSTNSIIDESKFTIDESKIRKEFESIVNEETKYLLIEQGIKNEIKFVEERKINEITRIEEYIYNRLTSYASVLFFNQTVFNELIEECINSLNSKKSPLKDEFELKILEFRNYFFASFELKFIYNICVIIIDLFNLPIQKIDIQLIKNNKDLNLYIMKIFNYFEKTDQENIFIKLVDILIKN